MNLGWIILLIGAEYAYAYQNVETYEFEPVYTNISLRLKKLGALQITHLMVKRFCDEKPSLNAGQISRTLKMPIRLVDDLLEELVRSGIVSKTMQEEFEEPEFQPASDVNLWTVNYITAALEANGLNHLPAHYSEDLKALDKAMQKIDNVVKGSAENILIKNI
jgi:membrane protein